MWAIAETDERAVYNHRSIYASLSDACGKVSRLGEHICADMCGWLGLAVRLYHAVQSHKEKGMHANLGQVIPHAAAHNDHSRRCSGYLLSYRPP